MKHLKLLLISLLTLESVVGHKYSIHNVSGLIEFSNLVNSGKNSFDGTTVTLEDDIFFPEIPPEASHDFNPI